MASMSKAQLIGNLGKPADLKFTDKGVPVCAFSMAVQVGFGERAKTDWWDVKFFGQRAEKVAQYLDKGTSVFVDGRLEKREWTDKDGNRRTGVEVIANDVTLLGGGQRSGAGGSQNSARAPQQRAATPPFGQEDDDGELPF